MKIFYFYFKKKKLNFRIVENIYFNFILSIPYLSQKNIKNLKKAYF